MRSTSTSCSLKMQLTAYDADGKRIPSALRASGYPPASSELPLFHGRQSQHEVSYMDSDEQAAPRPSHSEARP